MSTTELAEQSPSAVDGRRRFWVRTAVVVGGVLFASFWVWALFFASKEAVNRIGDRAWAERAEQICADADARRVALADFREMDDATPAMVREKADIVDRATDVLEGMLDELVAVTPSDEKGRQLVPLWEAEYRMYLGDRRAFTDELRRSGVNLPFYESTEQGIPISVRLETFAGDNDMASCAPPRDLTR